MAGASRRRREIAENQDAIGTGPGCVALSDGHGGAPHIRSAAGARFAVRVTLGYLAAAMPGASSTAGDLATRLAASWRKLVFADVSESPLAAGDPIRAYGCTCLGVAATQRHGLFLQLGDGDILIFARSGEIRRFQEPLDLPGEQTHSLCEPDAASLTRVEAETWEEPPQMILLATDGLSKSYSTDDGFFLFGRDLLDRLRQPGGVAQVNAHLASWLGYISEHGSGDDISVGLMFREFREAAER
ncbi:MAG: PP2C family serine/threonine-protein phosphatase [Bryobacteraceae bacterium]